MRACVRASCERQYTTDFANLARPGYVVGDRLPTPYDIISDLAVDVAVDTATMLTVWRG